MFIRNGEAAWEKQKCANIYLNYIFVGFFGQCPVSEQTKASQCSSYYCFHDSPVQRKHSGEPGTAFLGRTGERIKYKNYCGHQALKPGL